MSRASEKGGNGITKDIASKQLMMQSKPKMEETLLTFSTDARKISLTLQKGLAMK